jgi:hypothetical protein
VAIRRDDDLDEVVVDAPEDSAAVARAPTKPLRKGSIEVEIAGPADAEALAQFFELLAAEFRKGRKVKIIIE